MFYLSLKLQLFISRCRRHHPSLLNNNIGDREPISPTCFSMGTVRINKLVHVYIDGKQ